MSHERWYYFLSIEKDFAKTIDFVHLDTANFKAFSNEYAKLLLLIGSEVDVVAKLLCKNIDPAANPQNINEYRQMITAAFAGMHTVEIEIARFGLKVRPWTSWDPAVARSPSWWTAYNEVKHDRDNSFAQANQENTLNGLCGLMSLLLYNFKDDPHLQP